MKIRKNLPRIKRYYKPLPPHTWEAHPTASAGEVSKPFMIGLITVVALILLSLFLFFQDELVGKAFELGRASVGVAEVSPFITGQAFSVPIRANLGAGKQTVALGFKINLPTGLTCDNLETPPFQSQLNWNTGVIVDVNNCVNGVATFRMGTINPDLVTPQTPGTDFTIANLRFRNNVPARTYSIQLSNVEIIDFSNHRDLGISDGTGRNVIVNPAGPQDACQTNVDCTQAGRMVCDVAATPNVCVQCVTDANCVANQQCTDRTCIPRPPTGQCTSQAPANAQLCPADDSGLTVDTTRRVVASCTDAVKCEYLCNQGYALNNAGVCVAVPVCSSTNLAACTTQSACEAVTVGGRWNTATNTCAPAPQCGPSNRVVCTSTNCASVGQGVWDTSGVAPVCRAAQCTGTQPANALLCTDDALGLAQDTPVTLVARCGTPKCEYSCADRFGLQNNRCEAVAVCSSTNRAVCTSINCVSVGQGLWNAVANSCDAPAIQCGNNVVETGEECDGRATRSCTGTSGYRAEQRCLVASCRWEACTNLERCGDGLVTAQEVCDDQNTRAGDGCSATCTIEAGYTCTGTERSQCTHIPPSISFTTTITVGPAITDTNLPSALVYTTLFGVNNEILVFKRERMTGVRTYTSTVTYPFPERVLRKEVVVQDYPIGDTRRTFYGRLDVSVPAVQAQEIRTEPVLGTQKVILFS